MFRGPDRIQSFESIHMAGMPEQTRGWAEAADLEPTSAADWVEMVLDRVWAVF